MILLLDKRASGRGTSGAGVVGRAGVVVGKSTRVASAFGPLFFGGGSCHLAIQAMSRCGVLKRLP